MTNTEPELLTISEVAALLRISVRLVRSRLYRRTKDPDCFPMPVSGEGWESLWKKSHVEDYLQRRYARKFLPLKTEA